MIHAHEIHIADRRIASDRPSYFIADIAANHDGDLGRAKALIHLAKEAGADCAKFQHFLAGEIVSDYGFRTMGGQQSHQAKWRKSVFEVYEQFHCPRAWTDELVSTCREAGIDFMTTPYDFAAIDAFAPLVPAFKAGSGDVTWTAALERMARTGKPVLLACGASTMEDVERAVAAVLAHNRQIVLMQCNTNYTADVANFRCINLNVLRTFADRWPGMVLGLSDHTPGHSTVLGAVALGARVIEKHFTDDNSREGPDHHFAMNPATWREMVDRTRELELALGDGIKRVEANETDTVVIQRRAVRAKRDLRAGEYPNRDDFEMLRPCPVGALAPFEVDTILNRPLIRDVPAGDHLSRGDFEV